MLKQEKEVLKNLSGIPDYQHASLDAQSIYAHGRPISGQMQADTSKKNFNPDKQIQSFENIYISVSSYCEQTLIQDLICRHLIRIV